MKLEMNSAEATTLFSAVAQASRVTELETKLADVQRELESAERGRREAWTAHSKIDSELYDLRRNTSEEIAALKREVERLLDQTKPFPKERKISLMFHQFRNGQKIQAIKSLREAISLDLRSAKDVVEGVFVDVSKPQLLALSKVFAGIEAGLPVDHLRTELVKTAAVDELVGKRGGEDLTNDLNAIVHGEFHTYF